MKPQQLTEVAEGKDQFLDLYDSLPDRLKGDLYAFGSLDAVWKITDQNYFSQYEKQWVCRRLKKGMRAILLDIHEGVLHTLLARDKREMRDTRLLPRHDNQDYWTAVSNNEAMIFDCNIYRPKVTAIRDPYLVHLLADHHKMLWEHAVKPA